MVEEGKGGGLVSACKYACGRVFSAADVQEQCVCVCVCARHSVSCQALRRGGSEVHQAGTAVGLLNVGSGLQGGSTQASLITAQMPLFIFRTVQLILVPASEPLGKSDLLLPLGAAHVLSLTPSARQAFKKTSFKANIVFMITARRQGLHLLYVQQNCVS